MKSTFHTLAFVTPSINELKLGVDAIGFMNDGIADAHTVIILYSKHTPQAKWQKLGIYSAVWNEVAQSGGVCMVVRLDDSQIPPLAVPDVGLRFVRQHRLDL